MVAPIVKNSWQEPRTHLSLDFTKFIKNREGLELPLRLT